MTRIPDELDLTPVESLAYAQRLLDEGLAFNAHEVLEAAWKSSPGDQKPLWQAMAQLAVGITHVQRGNVDGALAVLHRAAARLAAVDRTAPYSVDVGGLIEYAATLMGELGAGVRVPAEGLRPALTSRT